MNVAIIDPSREGGIVDYTTCLINNLSKKVNITLIVAKNNNYPNNFNKKEILYGRTTTSFKGLINKIKVCISNIAALFKTIILIDKFNLIHIEWDPFIPFTPLFIALCKIKNKKIIWTVHNIFPHETNFLINNYYIKIYKSADLLIVHSDSDKKILTGYNIKNIAVIPHGEYGCIYKKFNVKKNYAKKKLGITGKIVLFFGNVREYKGLDYLINAMKGINATLLIAGDCENKKELIKKLDYSGIRFKTLLKFLNEKEVGLVFSASDVLVLPYLKISQSGVLFIGLGYNLPIIGTNISGLKEVINKNIGALVNPKDSKSLNKSIVNIITGKFKIDKKRYMEEVKKYSWDNIAVKTIKEYNKVIQK